MALAFLWFEGYGVGVAGVRRFSLAIGYGVEIEETRRFS